MLYLNVSERVTKQWGRTIDLYHSLHLGGLHDNLKSVNLLIEEELLETSGKILFRCELTLIPVAGNAIKTSVEREDCGAAIEQSFAKAKRYMIRRMRGFSDTLSPSSISSSSDLTDRL